MPKQVDHEERRRALIEALFRVAARDGLGAVSIRAVATEAGVPAPQVQYYFGTKAQLLTGALEHLGRHVVGRGLVLMQAAGEDASPEALLRAAVTGAQPIDDEGRHDLVLFFSFYVAAMTEPSIAETDLLGSQRWITQYFASLIRDAQARGETNDGIDPDHEARLILFANTGLTLGTLVGVHGVDDARATMDYLLARIFRSPS